MKFLLERVEKNKSGGDNIKRYSRDGRHQLNGRSLIFIIGMITIFFYFRQG
jgi:hypothetical protein